MRKSIIPRPTKSMLIQSVMGFLLLFVLIIPHSLFGQCPTEVSDLPDDFVIMNNDECEAVVTWTEPSYSLDCDDFSASFATGEWTLNTNGQNGSVNTAGAPASISLTAASDGTPGTNTNTDYCITIPFDGNINFDWEATAIGGGAQLINDEPAYTLDGVETQINVTGVPVGTGVSNEAGVVEDLAVTEGQEFCFRVKSNNQGATTTMDITNFSFEITEIEQTAGVANNSTQSVGDYDIEYTVLDCDGSATSCTFTVSVRETIAPEVVCPADITMNTDTDRCSAVVCYNVEVMDNCDPVLPEEIPGYEFLGTFDDHNYFVSDPGNILGWEEANIAANEVGGHLVVVTSTTEQEFLIDNLPLGTYWIGLRFSPSLDQFKWVNGEPFVFDAWGPGQPGGLLVGDYVFNMDFLGTPLDGWYDAPSLLPGRFIVEIDTHSKELTAGLPAGSSFPVGTTEVSYIATDASGNTDECSFNVIVIDNQAPAIDCPADSIIQLTQEQCDTIVIFEIPSFTDNCPDAEITQIGGLTSGSVFPIGENIVTFEARDTTGNADTCSWSIIINDFIPQGLLCKGAINFSLDDASCSGALTPSMLIDVSSVGCADSCTISIVNEDDTRRPAVFTSDDIGQTLDYEICCGGICCWGEVTVEFKKPPLIVCVENDTLSCTQAFDESTLLPDLSLSCADADLILLDEVIEPLICDTLFTSRMTRTYVAIDDFGNTSDTCSQMIFLRRTNLDSISPVIPFALFNSNALSCSSGFATTSQGYPFPALSVTGAPRLRVENGGFVDLFPFDTDIICNGFADFEDEILPGSTSCVTKIRRTFTIGEWWCSQTNEREFVQLIEVVDFEGPQVTCPSDITISTASFTCEGFVALDLPAVSDPCNGNDIRIDLSAPTSPSGFISDYDGGTIMLPVGVNEITYRVYDDCNNRTDCRFFVTVQDDADPIAICDQFTTVGIGLEDLTKVTAESIDDGSFDECGDVTLSVARMDEPGFDDFTGFGPDVDINCADVGTVVMVGLLVTDAGGNTNMCMVSIEVTDKIDAKFTCPGDMEVECNFAFDPDNLDAFFGEVEIFDNCPESNEVVQRLIGDLNTCGAGVLTREIRLLNAQGVQVDICTQQITFRDGDPLRFSDITPPASEVTVTGCGIESIDPSILGMPIVPDGLCQQAAIGIENDTFPFTENGACLKIIRTFNVIDWCIDDGPGSVLEPFQFVQTIKVNNTEGPEIAEIFADTVFCSFEVDCGGINVNDYLVAEFTDDCTVDNDLLNRYEVRNSDGELVRFGVGLDASGAYDVDSYTVRFISEDKCGNQTFEEASFEVRSCKQPTPYCLQGLSTTLTAMDTTGDGTADLEMVMLTADFFDAGSYHPCGYDVVVSFSEDVNDTLRSFFCSDTVGVQPIELWVTDEFGGQAFCTTFLDVQDNDEIDLCSGARPADIAGRIYTASDAELSSVEVVLQGLEIVTQMTDEEGAYKFGSMPLGGDYKVTPRKDNDFMNGLSTLDIVLTQQHILGLKKLDSPYKILAADINNNKKITSADLLELRRMILGINDHFPDNQSWRFVDAQFEFADETDPWQTPIKEAYTIDGLSGDMQVDFVAIKTGDVSGDVDMNIAAGVVTETRSNEVLTLNLPNIEVERGSLYEVQVKSNEAATLFGMQYALDVEGLEVVNVLPGVLDMKSAYMADYSDHMNVSYASAYGDELQEDDVLFTLVIKAKSDGQLSDMIALSDYGLMAEAYQGQQLAIADITLDWRDSESATLVDVMSLKGNSPNPWRFSTDIGFYLPAAGNVQLIITDVNGRLLINKTTHFNSGEQTFILTDNDIQISGVLFFELRYEDQIMNGKMIKIK